jgi:hypothetical protein
MAAWAGSPRLPEWGVSAQSQALAGGGAASSAGASGLSVNPASIADGGGWDVEAGFTDLRSGGPIPYLVYGQSAAQSGLAFAAHADWRDSAWVQGFLAGYAFSPWRGPWVGVALRAETVGEEPGVDADLGLRWRRGPWRLGASLRRVLASGAGAGEKSFPAARQWQSGLGWDPGFFFLRPTLDYEFHAPDFSVGDLDHLVSLSACVFPEESLRLRLSGRIPQREPGTMGWGAGLALRFRLFHALAEGLYAVAYRSPEAKTAELSHGLSLRVRGRAFRDRVPPRVRIGSDRVTLSPDSGAPSLSFLIRVEDNRGQPKAWKLSIHPAKPDGGVGSRAHVLEGSGLPPGVIQWAGKDASGRALPAGNYLVRLWAEDVDGNAATSPWRLIEILPATPAASEPEGASFLPNGEETP